MSSSAKKSREHSSEHGKHREVDVWSVSGKFQHVIFSPKGSIEGFLIDTEGTPTQFVTDPHDPAMVEKIGHLREGQVLEIEGIEADPSSKGDADHTVYELEKLVSVDGKPLPTHDESPLFEGTVVRFNYAKHGARNGVILNTGDFIHTKPGGLADLDIEIGDQVTAEGDSKSLWSGKGRVVEARVVNGTTLDNKH